MHRETAKRLAETLSAMWMVPVLASFFCTTERGVVREDVHRWLAAVQSDKAAGLGGFLHLLGRYPEFRTLYYYRLRRGNLPGAALGGFLSFFYRGQYGLFLECPVIGPGLFLQHAFSTIVSARSIGKNCWINQQVTIGFKDDSVSPILGDNVVVNAGAKVLGPIQVGDNVIIGANAVVIKDVPDDCVVVGVPARIVRRGGVRVHEALDIAD